MFRKLLILSSLLVFVAIFAQKSHTVSKGDNPYNIAKKYGMTMEELAKLNPGIKDGKLAIGDVVKVSGKKETPKPVAEKPKTTEKPKEVVEHHKTVTTSVKLGKITLQPKQTIYGITKQYHISEAELRKLNPNLDSGMKIGDEIVLPLENIKNYGGSQKPVATTKPVEKEEPKQEAKPTEETKMTSDGDTYKVQPKDNYYRITKNFGITQKQLFDLNPGLEEKGLQPGTTIKIKGDNVKVAANTTSTTTQVTETKTNTTSVKTSVVDDYGTYTVKDGDTVFGILNKFGIGLDELLTLNPELNNGLKAGMVLKVKKLDAAYVKKSGDALNVVLMMPFAFDVNDSKYRSMAADFLAGAKLAIERNTRQGMKLDVKVVDSGSEQSFKNSLAQINQDNMDLIVGPFFKSNVIEVMNYLGNKKIPVVAPFANSSDLFGYSNLIIVNPENKTYAERIAKEVSQVYSDQKIYIVADADKSNANLLKGFIEKSIKNPTIIMVNSALDIQADKNMMTGQSAPVIAVLADDDTDKGNAFASRISDLAKETQGMKTFSMFYQSAFEKNQKTIDELSQASLVYLMDRTINPDGDFEKEILADFKQKYCKTPSKFSVIGFDVMNDVLTRENKKGEIFKQINKSQTQLATKFEYARAKANGAYINTGYRVVRLLPQ